MRVPTRGDGRKQRVGSPAASIIWGLVLLLRFLSLYPPTILPGA